MRNDIIFRSIYRIENRGKFPLKIKLLCTWALGERFFFQMVLYRELVVLHFMLEKSINFTLIFKKKRNFVVQYTE